MNHDDANDLLQNVFIKVWGNIENFRGDSSLSTWLYRIATNEALSFLNQQKRKRGLLLNTETEYLANQLKADVYFEGDEIQRKLMEAVVRLPEKQTARATGAARELPQQLLELLDRRPLALRAHLHPPVGQVARVPDQAERQRLRPRPPPKADALDAALHPQRRLLHAGMVRRSGRPSASGQQVVRTARREDSRSSGQHDVRTAGRQDVRSRT